GLQTLRRAELIYELPRIQQNALLAFRHPLIQEVAYHNLLSDRKTELHAAAAKALLHYFQDRMDEGAAILAHHFERAGDMLSAAQAHARSAAWLGANDSTQALATWRKVHSILRTQPSHPDINFLRGRACGQIVNLGWREGLSAVEARGFFEEASKLAMAGKNFRGNALLHAAYGRILAATGSADEYVAKIKEAQLLGGFVADPSLRVTLQSVLAHALRLSGRLKDALAVNGEALGHCSDLAKYEREVLGFDLEPWLLAMRGQTLVLLGRGAEARPFLEQVIAMDGGRIDATHHVIPSLAYVEWAWATQNCELAQEHAERAVRIGEGSHSPYLRVYSGWAQGLTYATAGRNSEAIDQFSSTLDFARRRKAGLENECRLLADLANVHLCANDAERALDVADEAIRVARLRHQRIPEFYAHLVSAAALSELEAHPRSKEEREIANSLYQDTSAALFAMRFGQGSGMNAA
ncbi:MAG: cyclase, partial [Methylobacteriaceae bacterium]|nr:cyclase [Methylobacteriaceae bacterium]